MTSPREPSVSPELTLRNFLQALWVEEPLPGCLVAWTLSKQNRRSESRWCLGPEDLGTVLKQARSHRHIYFGVALQDQDKALVLARHDRPDAKLEAVRGSKESALAIPGLWVDLDFQADVHSSQDLPPDEAAALGLVEAVPLDPSIIIHTGYGLHVYWLFREPWIFESDKDRQAAEDLAKRLQQTIRLRAQERGWSVDSTADLARVLRLPGSLNHKGKSPKEVRIRSLYPDRRYNPEDFENKLVELIASDGHTPRQLVSSAGPSRDEGPPADLARVRERCAWIRHCYEDRASLSEPEWYAALSIVGRCGDVYQDGRELAHQWSQGHVGYEAQETDRKLDHALRDSGPRTCAYIAQELGAGEMYCDLCAHRGKVKSPIVLGRERHPKRSIPYRATEQGLVHERSTKDGVVPVPLTNFVAEIVHQIVRDDGAETHSYLEIEARCEGRSHRFMVEAAKFSSMSWVVESMGPQAVVYAGFGAKDHARAAIQLLSGEPTVTTVYTHLGWRDVGGKEVFLHEGGAIGSDGPVAEIRVEPPDGLVRFSLPEPPDGEELARAVRSGLDVLDLLPGSTILPLFCGIWRAVFGSCDFTLHLCGQTGEGKSEVAALVQQFFGAGMDARHLPGSWSSTGNALEILAFAAKDVLLVIDDFAPEGSQNDIQRQHREAARILRAQGNRSGRQRLRPDATLRPTKAPRGLILSTGEEVPKGQSIRARMLIVDVPAGGMDWERLTQCQKDAAAGTYAKVLSGFICWLAPQLSSLRKTMDERLISLRQEATALCGQHRRTPSIVAELVFGLDLFVAFVSEKGLMSEMEAKELRRRGWSALIEAASAQSGHTSSEDPVQRFPDLLRSALTSGHCHLVSSAGDRPDDSRTWGWRQREISGDPIPSSVWEPLGKQVGWIDGEDLYLEPTAAYRVAQIVASTDGLTMTERTLWKRMSERGMLASTDQSRNRHLVRKMLQGSRRTVLHLHSESLMFQESAQSAQSAQSDGGMRVDGPFSWAVSDAYTEKGPTETAHKER